VKLQPWVKVEFAEILGQEPHDKEEFDHTNPGLHTKLQEALLAETRTPFSIGPFGQHLLESALLLYLQKNKVTYTNSKKKLTQRKYRTLHCKPNHTCLLHRPNAHLQGLKFHLRI
jgi:hypothetical protein